MKKFSIIIPVYNAEKNIIRCVNSVLNQTYKNFEIILINDGSNDNSEKIIKEIQEENNDIIKYYYKENKGVSNTRNYGLNIATGEYIIFVDADDFLEINSLEKINRQIEDNDILIYNWKEISEKDSIMINMKETQCDSFEKFITEDFNELWRYVNPVWNKAIKKEIIKSIEFNEKMSLGEDLLFNIQVMYNSKKIKVLNEFLYNYTVSEDGLSLKKRELRDYKNNLFCIVKTLQDISNKCNGNIFKIIMNEIYVFCDKISKDYNKREFFLFIKEIPIEYCQKIEIKNVGFKNKIIYYLLKNKQYKLLCYFFIIKNKLRGESNE